MATNKDKNSEKLGKKTINFDVPVEGYNENDNTEMSEDQNSLKNIDAVCSMIDKAKKDKATEEEDRRKDIEKKQQQERNNAMAAKKAADEKAKQEERIRKINEAKYMRKKSKYNAAIMSFSLSISSAVFGYVVIGILIWTIFKPSVWLFVGIMGIIGMIDTFLHTYLYRFIREEIYRK